MAVDRVRVAGRQDVWRVLAWIAVTVVATLIVYLACAPVACVDVPICRDMHRTSNPRVQWFAVCALITALSTELSAFCLSWVHARRMVGIIRNIEYTFIPPLILVFALGILILENLAIAKEFLVHAAAEGVGNTNGRPVYTAIIFEWLVNVSFLCILSGNCAMNRPLSEVSRPLLVTNIYIIVCWAAYFVPDVGIRWTLIAIGLIMYVWASYDMVMWVVEFRKTTRCDLPSRDTRSAMAVGLIILYFIYGCIYLAGHLDLVPSNVELTYYVVMDLGSKLGFVFLFVGVRSSQFYDLLVSLIANKVVPFERQAAQGGANIIGAVADPADTRPHVD